MKFIGYTIKGIEEIAKNELLNKFSNAVIERVESKAIIFEIEEPDLNALRNLRTFDDIAFWSGEIPYDENLDSATLKEAVGGFSFVKYRKLLQKYRDIKSTEFSLTVSLPGFQYINVNYFKDELADYLAEERGWNYAARDHSQFDIRLFKGDKTIIVGVKIFAGSLHKRDYKQDFRRGSLRPTIAAALVQLATDNKPGTFVDNFCGSGTILAEAFIDGNDIYGGDIHKGSVHFTHNNLKNLDFKNLENIKVQDAVATDFPDQYFDYAVSNMPWGKQIEFDKTRDIFDLALKEYRRILKKEGVLVLLVKQTEIVLEAVEKYFPEAKVTSFTISLVGQQPTVIKIDNK